MRKILPAFIILSISFFLAQGQAPLVKEWDYAYGGASGEALNSFIPTLDGGYVLGGYTSSDSSGEISQRTRGQQDFWIVKTNALGVKEWDRRFGGDSADILQSVVQTLDGGYLLGGYTNSRNTGDVSQTSRGGQDYWVVKTDSVGNKQWDKRFGGSSTDQLFSMVEAKEGGYFLLGYSNSGASGDKTQSPRNGDFWLLKINIVGSKLWDKTYGGSILEWPYSICASKDGGYMLFGDVNSDMNGDVSQPSRGATDYWLVKIDSAGNKKWDRRYGGDSTDKGQRVNTTKDGGYILGGISNSLATGEKTEPCVDTVTGIGSGSDFWLVKLDSAGNKQWDKRLGGWSREAAVNSVQETRDGGYLVSGISYSDITGDKSEKNLGVEQSWMIETDSAGNKQWDKTIFTNSGTFHDHSGFALETQDGGYILANYTYADTGGYKTQKSRGTYDYWLVKFKDTACLGSLGGVITTFNDTVCKDQPPVLHFSGIVQNVQWQYSTDGVNYIDLVGLTGEDCLDIPTQTSYYRVKSTDGNCPLITDPIKIVVDTTCQITGMEEWKEEMVRIYPNPSSMNLLQLSIDHNWVGGIIEVYDADGRIVFQSVIRSIPSEINAPLLSGVYSVRIHSEKGSIVKKFIRL